MQEFESPPEVRVVGGDINHVPSNQPDHSQSKKSLAGNEFQRRVFRYIEKHLKNPDLVLLKPSTHIYPGDYKGKVPFSCLQIHTPRGMFIGDTDIVVYSKKKRTPIVVISCKTSLRERYTQSLYSARLYRDKYGVTLPFFIVTRDTDLELGSEKHMRKPRLLADFERVAIYSTNSRTSKGGGVYARTDLIPAIGRLAV